MKRHRKQSSGTPSAACRRYGERYSARQNEATAALEREVIGGDFGANGYTTLAQANALLEVLDLRRRQRLLDVGAGRGWPGLYLAQQSGCEVVLTDLPEEGLREARRRARAADLAGESDCVVAAGAALPFRPRSFDAVVHSDVL